MMSAVRSTERSPPAFSVTRRTSVAWSSELEPQSGARRDYDEKEESIDRACQKAQSLAPTDRPYAEAPIGTKNKNQSSRDVEIAEECIVHYRYDRILTDALGQGGKRMGYSGL